MYMAPELKQALILGVSTTQYTEKVDVYSFGIVLCEMLYGTLQPQDQLQQSVAKLQKDENLFNWATVINMCIQQDPGVRPTILELRKKK